LKRLSSPRVRSCFIALGWSERGGGEHRTSNIEHRTSKGKRLRKWLLQGAWASCPLFQSPGRATRPRGADTFRILKREWTRRGGIGYLLEVIGKKLVKRGGNGAKRHDGRNYHSITPAIFNRHANYNYIKKML
jgi:hypothetical protein